MPKARSATVPSPPTGWSTGMLSSSSTLEAIYPPASAPSPSLPHPRTPYRHAFPHTTPLNYTRDSYASTVNLVPHSPDRGSRESSPKAKGFSMNWGWFSKNTRQHGPGIIDPAAHKREKTKDGSGAKPFYFGWQTAFFGSCKFHGYNRRFSAERIPDFNVLLLLIPASFFLSRSSIESDTLVFICTL